MKPMPEVNSLEEFLKVIEEDAYGRLYGLATDQWHRVGWRESRAANTGVIFANQPLSQPNAIMKRKHKK